MYIHYFEGGSNWPPEGTGLREWPCGHLPSGSDFVEVRAHTHAVDALAIYRGETFKHCPHCGEARVFKTDKDYSNE